MITPNDIQACIDDVRDMKKNGLIIDGMANTRITALQKVLSDLNRAQTVAQIAVCAHEKWANEFIVLHNQRVKTFQENPHEDRL